MINLCAPAIIYLIFCITQILIDTFKGLYNTAFIKIIVTIMVTFLLNILCEQGLGFVSWIIVFIPFILMTVIVSMILYIFSLDASTGSINYKYDIKNSQDIHIDKTIDALEYINTIKPNNYQYMVPNSKVNNSIVVYETIPTGSSSPAYQS